MPEVSDSLQDYQCICTESKNPTPHFGATLHLILVWHLETQSFILPNDSPSCTAISSTHLFFPALPSNLPILTAHSSCRKKKKKKFVITKGYCNIQTQALLPQRTHLKRVRMEWKGRLLGFLGYICLMAIWLLGIWHLAIKLNRRN